MFETPFFYQLTKKYIGLFGALFSNLTFIRYDSDTGTELQRIKVPVDFGDRERYRYRLVDPDYNRSVSIVLPRLAFTLVGREYDGSRRVNPLLRTPKAVDALTVDAGYTGVPYNLNFELSIISRNIDDANQILEQILPTFATQDYTVTALPLPGLGLIKDIPVILNSVQDDIQYDDEYETIRWVNISLNFTMKVYYYGPIQSVSIIKHAFANVFIDPLIQTGATVRVNVDAGNNGTFKLYDTVFQGNNMVTASAAGIVTDWHPQAQQLFIGAAQGQFVVNTMINAASTNAAYTLVSFDDIPQKVASIQSYVEPPTANIGDPFSANTIILEYPEPLE